MRASVIVAVLLATAIALATASPAAAGKESLSDELLRAADEVYPSRVAYCDELVSNATKFIVDKMSIAAQQEGLYSYEPYFPVELQRCGRKRDQLALITARLCDKQHGFIVTCDPTKTIVENNARYFKMIVELRRNVGAVCSCRASVEDPETTPSPPPPPPVESEPQ